MHPVDRTTLPYEMTLSQAKMVLVCQDCYDLATVRNAASKILSTLEADEESLRMAMEAI